MKSNLFFCIATLYAFIWLHSSPVKAQPCPLTELAIDWVFQADYDGLVRDDIAWDIEPIESDDDYGDGYVVVGEVYRGTTLKRQAYVIRLDANGDSVWQRTYGGTKNDVAYAVEQASDGNFIVCGTKGSTKFPSTPSNNYNVWFLKLDLSDGSILTEQEYGGSGDEDGVDIKEDVSNGYYVIVGSTGTENDYDLSGSDNINGSGEYWVLAIDTTTDTIAWQHTFHGTHTSDTMTRGDLAHSIAITHDGKYIVSGLCVSCETNMWNQQMMLVKIDAATHSYSRYYYGDEVDSNIRDQLSYNILEVYDGTSYRYLSTGIDHTPSGATPCYGNNHDFYGLKVTTGGTNSWTGGCHLDEGKNYGGHYNENGWCAVQTCDGGYLLVGTSNSAGDQVSCNNDNTNPYTYDAWMIKINTSGVKEWDESIGGVRNDEAHSIKQAPDGSYILAGEFGTENNGQNFYVVKFHLRECEFRLERDNNEANNLLSIYPNPSDGAFRISLQLMDELNQLTAIKIFDQVGRVVSSYTVTVKNGLLSEEIATDNLPSGYYWVSVITNGKTYQAKLVLQKS